MPQDTTEARSDIRVPVTLNLPLVDRAWLDEQGSNRSEVVRQLIQDAREA